jgi:hypothetical protein
LASAVNVDEVGDAPMVSLGPNGLFVDGQRADVIAAGEDPGAGPLPELTGLLRVRREQRRVLQPDAPPVRGVILHVDEGAPAGTVKRLVASVSRAGYEGVDFLVIRRLDDAPDR